jgi:TolB-like protein
VDKIVAENGAKGRRHLSAIFFADAVGYSRMMGEDEVATHTAVKRYLRTFEDHATSYGGKILQVRGDGVFALFGSVVNAVSCAIDVQRTIADTNQDDTQEHPITFRIGINLGDVVEDDVNVYGDSVNIAARIEEVAEPGGVCVSGAVYEQIKNKLRYGYEYLGPRELKNISEPIEVFRVHENPEAAVMAPSPRPLARGLKLDRDRQDKPSVVVLPFRDLSGDPEEAWFSDGITEDITTNLSKFHDLFVIARSSAFTYKDSAVKPQQAAEELGVRYTTQGSIRKSRNRVRISVELADAATGRTIWGERYDRELDDIFEVQDDITNRIVAATAVQIESVEGERTRRFRPQALEAYGLVLQGQQHLFRYTREDNHQARKLYEAALAIDPLYPRALAAVSRTLNLDWRYSWGDDEPDRALDKALELAQRSVQLDKTDARGFGELGFVHLYRKEHTASLRAYEWALSLNPNDADLMSDMADALAHSGRSEKAVELLLKALRLNPCYPDQYLWHLGGAYFNLKRYDEAIDTLLCMHNPSEGHRLLAASYGQLGRLAEARVQAAKVLEVHPNFSLDYWAKIQPDKYQEDVDHFIEGLRKAGL